MLLDENVNDGNVNNENVIMILGTNTIILLLMHNILIRFDIVCVMFGFERLSFA